ncbi:HIT family protein [Williamsia sp. 1135]|uniref:HIT family protein n=1 Tax=Williamsia sp. 1135 TaxID=1889262 RepID=UPI000A100308|nr:HIT family protein [Williamsia sp. 1135]ORM36314.1 HIT family protein [Williamsia sp. 1135]
MSDCVFCAIVAGSSPAHVVYEDDDVLGFLDIRPVRPGHTLLIPKRHAANLAELSPDQGGKLFQAGQRVAAAQRASAIAADGVNLLVNDGRAAFQTVFHSHLHVVPRHNGDKLVLAKSLLTRRDNDLPGTAEILRSELQGS